MNKTNFPIKYALQPIYESINSEEEALFYIISKCFLVGDNIKYYEDGSILHYYEIVFPYKEEFVTLLNNKGIKRKPQFDYKNSCYNQDYTYKLYDSYEDALEDRIIINKEKIDKYLSTFTSNSELYKKAKILIKNKIYSIQKVEEIINENTKDLIITEDMKL